MNVSFNHDLMTSFQFEAYWKRGFEMRRADLNVVSKEESYDLAEIEPTAELWKYDLSVRSENVPLTDSLVIVVLAPNGETISRLTGRP